MDDFKRFNLKEKKRKNKSSFFLFQQLISPRRDYESSPWHRSREARVSAVVLLKLADRRHQGGGQQRLHRERQLPVER